MRFCCCCCCCCFHSLVVGNVGDVYLSGEMLLQQIRATDSAVRQHSAVTWTSCDDQYVAVVTRVVARWLLSVRRTVVLTATSVDCGFTPARRRVICTLLSTLTVPQVCYPSCRNLCSCPHHAVVTYKMNIAQFLRSLFSKIDTKQKIVMPENRFAPRSFPFFPFLFTHDRERIINKITTM